MDASYNEMDANMFNQYMYKSNDENVDVSSIPQSYNNNDQQQQSLNQTYHEMNDQTFHTPSFGDEEFDIPLIHHQQPTQPQHHQLDQYHQLQNHQMGIMSDQQTGTAYQWHHQQQSTAESQMMANQTYQLQTPSSAYHHLSSSNQQMLLMQPPTTHQPPQQLEQLNQPQISSQLNAGGSNYIEQSPLQNGSTSDDSDDNTLNNTFKRPSPDPFADGDLPKGSGAKKMKPAVKKVAKKKKDPNEPQKPVSAYALFFQDTQAAIKGQNPNASFGEVSKIVASMWEVLEPEHKNVYKKKTEAAKKDYLKALAAYRASLVSQGTGDSQSPPHLQTNSATTRNISQQQQSQSQHQMQVFPPQQMAQTQSYQQSFVNQSMMNITQPQNNMMNLPQQHGTQNQYMNQQLHQMNQATPVQQQQQSQQQNLLPMNNNNQMPPVSGNTINPIATTQNCIRNGCTNVAIVSNDWEDEYCSNECVVTHCRDVFGNWVANQSGAHQQHQGFPVVK